MARRFRPTRPTWTQADYQEVKRDYHRHKLMTKVVDSILTSRLNYNHIAKKAGVAQATITRWVTGDTKNGKIDTIMSVLEALNMEMVLVTREEAQDHTREKEKVTHVRTKSVTAS